MLIKRKRPIFNVLDNKSSSRNKYLPFKVFINNNSYNLKDNSLLKDRFQNTIDEIGSMLFNDFRVDVDLF